MEWYVSVDEQMVRELANSFAAGLLNDDGTHRLEEVVVGRIDGLKVEIFANEHPPPHFKVSFQGEANTFNICTGAAMHGNAMKKATQHRRLVQRKSRPPD